MKVAQPDESTELSRFPESIARWMDRFTAFWSYPVLQLIWIRVTLLLLVTGFCLARAYVGLMGTQGYSHDAFMLLDGAWRMLNGQRPHIDFYSHVGVLTYAPTLVGFWITNGMPAAFGYGQAVSGLLLGAWAYLLCRKRLNDVSTVLMCLAVAMMTAAPSALGFQPLVVVSAMTYNRCGYAIFALILVEALSEPKQDREASDFWGGVSTGLALSFLLFLKITYFVFALFFLAIVALLRARTQRSWAGLLAGFAAFSIVVCAYFGFNLKPMFSDLATVARSKHLNLNWYAYDVIVELAGAVSVLSLMGAAVLVLTNKRGSAKVIAVGGLTVSVIGVVMILGNYEQSGFPLTAFMAIIVANAVTASAQPLRGAGQALQIFALLLSSVFVLVFLGTDAITMPYALAVKLIKAPQASGLMSPTLRTFVPVDVDRAYANFVNDGLRLVSEYRRPGESIMSLDFTNPFSYGLSAKPAPGGTTVLQFRTTFDSKWRQTAESLFGSADLVALPKPGAFSDISLESSIVPIYGSYLESHFRLIGQSAYWKLYRQNKGT